MERLRSAHGEPAALLRNRFPAGLLGPDGGRWETTGLYRLMRRAGIAPHRARQTVDARTAADAEAELLGEPAGAPVLALERTTYDGAGRPVESGSHVHRASRYTFEFQLLARGQGPPPGGGPGVPPGHGP